VAVFLVLVLVPGWTILAVPVLAARGLLPGGRLPVEPFALVVTLLVMLPAALWVTAVVDGRPGVRDLLGRVVRWRIGPGWWAAVLLALPVTAVIVGLALDGERTVAGGVPSAVLRGVMALALAVLVIHLWEEAVWTGFLQTRLSSRYGLVVAALLTAVPFTAVHVPLLLVDETSLPALLRAIGLLLVLAAVLRLLVGVFLRGTGSVLAVAVLHAMFNASNNRGGLVDRLLQGSEPDLAAPIALVLVTVAAAVATRGRPEAATRPEPVPRPPAPFPVSTTRGGVPCPTTES
jgi:membrane protease YdiL (CAAX protease family)